MCCSVAPADSELTKTELKTFGLVDGHAYSLIKAKEINLDFGGTEKLL